MADHLRDLEISVNKRMDSGLQGGHSSSTFGASVEFAEYREYMQGDPIERIDWMKYETPPKETFTGIWMTNLVPTPDCD